MTSQSTADLATGSTQPVAPGVELVSTIVKLLEPYPLQEQVRIIQTVATWLTAAGQGSIQKLPSQVAFPQAPSADYPFSARPEVTPKEFLLEKDPKTDAERLTCLAYYLTHYRDQPYFRTEDLSKLNTEAAQRRFANTAFTAKNALRDGFLVQAPKKNFRQLSALGEQYAQALPNHQTAREVRERMRTNTRRSRTKSARPQAVAEQSQENLE